MRYNSFKSAGNVHWGRFSALYVYRRQLMWGAAGLSVFYGANLEQAPVSHRLRFMIVPRWLEMHVGEQAYNQTMGQFKANLLPDSHPKTRRVKEVMDRLVKVADLPEDLQWQVHVVQGPFPPNAFVLPGGKVFVFDSILPICRDNDGLATILSHETAHQVCRHSAESMSKTPLKILAGVILFALTGYGRLDDILIELALELPSSRQMETEADHVGVMMMAKACFEPSSALGVWQRMVDMEKQRGVSVPELLSTHPASAHRIQNIKKLIPEAETIKEDNCGQMQAFKAIW